MTTENKIYDLSQLLLDGLLEKQRRHKDGEGAALGNLRAGNSGMASDTGDIAGACHRRAHLRTLGIEVEHHTPDKLLMFELGIANEDIVVDKLEHSLPEGYVLMRESEIPTSWQTKNGTKVTGRPDIVIVQKYDTEKPGVVVNKPVLGIELKSVASVYTTNEVLFEGKPKIGHMIQAAHYMWQLGIPYRLNYKQYANQVAADWLTRKWPKPGQPLSEHIEYNDKGGVKYTKPFEITYELDFGPGGFLRYRREGTRGQDGSKGTSQPWHKTIIRSEDIERFFEVASRVSVDGLGRRPMTIDAFGKEKSYSDCVYCPLQATCDKVDKVRKAVNPLSYLQWLDEVREVTKVR